MTPKPTADQQTVEALRGVLRQIRERIAGVRPLSGCNPWAALSDVDDLARRALAATETEPK